MSKRDFENYVATHKDTKTHNQVNNKGSIAYMSKDNVKKFSKAMEKKMFNSSGIGRPYAFSSVEELEKDIEEYFDACREYNMMPTNVSLALWLGCDEDTLNNHANNPNSPFFGVIKNVKQYLHSLMQSGTLAGDINPVTYIFLSKNYYGMKDDKNITVTPATSNSTNSQETMDAIQKQLQEETVPNANYQED